MWATSSPASSRVVTPAYCGSSTWASVEALLPGFEQVAERALRAGARIKAVIIDAA